MSLNAPIAVLIAHPTAARFAEFRRLWRAGHYPSLAPDRVNIAFSWTKRPRDLQSCLSQHRPDLLIVHGSLLGDQPAQAAMWVLTQGTAGVLITDDSDPSRQFQTKRCRVLPLHGAPDSVATALSVEISRLQQERETRSI